MTKPKKAEKSRYTFTYFEVPNALKLVIQVYLDDYLPFVGRIVDRFDVHFVTEEVADFELAVNVRREYRSATIFVAPKFLQLDEAAQRLAICHELCHIFTDPIYIAALDVVENFVPEEISPYVEEQIRKANELAVDDMSRFMIDCDEKRS